MSEPHTADLPTRYRYREEGRELERERIIKLIQDHALEFADWSCSFNGHGVTFDDDGFIALIKGETD